MHLRFSVSQRILVLSNLKNRPFTSALANFTKHRHALYHHQHHHCRQQQRVALVRLRLLRVKDQTPLVTAS